VINLVWRQEGKRNLIAHDPERTRLPKAAAKATDFCRTDDEYRYSLMKPAQQVIVTRLVRRGITLSRVKNDVFS
jgi:hypothetical protein